MTQVAPRRTNLLQVPLTAPPAGGQAQLSGYRSEVPAGSESGWHRHQYATLVYVLAGTYRLEVGAPGSATEYTAGQMFSEPAGVAVNGRAVTDSALLVVLPVEAGKPESQPV